jgi:DNA-binding SARP family transcriptional activator
MSTHMNRRIPSIRLRILGTLEFWGEQRWCRIGAAKQRALLAALLLNANQVVPTHRLVTELWPDQTPASANGLLAGYVWRLRRELRDSAGQVLSTRPPGYQLNLPKGALDVHDYERLVASGRASLAAHDPAAAVESFTAALGLWRGAPLADVAPSPSVMAEAARLDESRLAVLETRFGAEIELGRHEALLPELKLMVSQNPLRERLHAHLMLALYRSGQQAEALGAYHDLRRLLINELGIEPSKPLRDLHERILGEDLELLLPTAGGRIVISSPAARPRLLPPDPDVFVGRTNPLATMTERLLAGGVCAVYGPAGTGKSALALRAAHAAAAQFTDGQLWLDMRGSTAGGALSPHEAVTALLGAFGVPPDAVGGPDAQAARLTEVMSGRRVLVVLDDVAGTEQVRPLLNPPPGWTVLLTGRVAIGGLGAHRQVRTGRLSAAESVELLRRLAGAARIDTDPAAVTAIIRLCEYLPLALSIAARRLTLRPEWTLDDFATRLADPRRRLDLLTGEEHSVRESIRASVRLTENDRDPDTRMAVHLLGALDLPVVDTGTLAALLDSPQRSAIRAAERLVDLGLIESLGTDRYRVPDMVRLFAREAQDALADSRAAVGRVVERYVELVAERTELIREQGGHEPVRSGLAWFRRELGTLRALADRDHTDMLHKAVDQLRSTLSGVLRDATTELHPKNIGTTSNLATLR